MAVDLSASIPADAVWARAVALRLAGELAELRAEIGSLRAESWRSASAESFARMVHEAARDLARGEAALGDAIDELAAHL